MTKNLRSLKYLGAAGYRTGDEGARTIAEDLRSLISLNISWYRIEDKGARSLAQLTALKYLTIWKNEIGEKVEQELCEKFRERYILF